MQKGVESFTEKFKLRANVISSLKLPEDSSERKFYKVENIQHFMLYSYLFTLIALMLKAST